MQQALVSSFIVLALAATAAPAEAQGNAAQAPPSSTATPAAAPAASANHYSTAATPLGQLLADPSAKAVIDAHIPGLSTNPQIGQASNMTLRDIQQMAPNQ